MQNQPPQIDTLYQTFGKNLYKITGQEQYDSIMDVINANPSANNSTMVNVPADVIGSGQGTGMTQVSTGGSMSGKQSFGDMTAGYFLGIDTDGVAKWNFGNSTNYIKWDGSILTVVGGVSVSSLNIPDTTTANSFHVDTSGNTWWGANVASGIGNANASVTSAGGAIFKNVQIGGVTTQYVITNSGIFSYGDGSDGVATFNGSTTPAGSSKSGNTYNLTRDVYYSTVTISDGVDIITNGWRIFCSLSLTIGGGASGKIHWDGNNATSGTGGNGYNQGRSGGTGGTGGAALTAGYFSSQAAGGNGGNGSSGYDQNGGNGSAATSVSNSIGVTSGAGGGGGSGTDSTGIVHNSGGNGGGVGTATASNVKLIANWHLATLLDITSTGATLKFTGSGTPGGAGGGGGGYALANNGSTGGGGGGSGTDGGIVAIYAKVVVLNSGSSITSNGGTGGNGGQGGYGSGGKGGAGGGGAGAGGNDGVIVLVYNSLTNNGSITTNAGASGSIGTGQDSGANGSAATAGSAGVIYQFQLSL